MLGALLGLLGEELRALEEDEDVHSVSVISAGLDTNTEHFSPCAIDCWLKQRTSLRDPLPSLDAWCWDLSARVRSGGRDRGDIYSPLADGHTRILFLEPGFYGDETTGSLAAHPCVAVGPPHILMRRSHILGATQPRGFR